MRTKRVSITIISILLTSTFFATLTIVPDFAGAATLYVGGVGPGNFTTIQSAIDAAGLGDTIYVFNGTYYENIEVNTSVSLVGENRDTTTIEGVTDWAVVNVTADNVHVSGFRIVYNGFERFNRGLDFLNVTRCSAAGNNLSINQGYGIRLYESDNITIHDNIVTRIGGMGGIYVMGSHYSMLTNNRISNQRDGIELILSRGSVLSNNSISDSYWAGIDVYGSTDTVIMNNTMMNDGIRMSGSSLDKYNTHTISISNTVNGRPIRYWKNVTGGKMPSNTGQVILANVTDAIIENMSLPNVVVGIEQGYTSRIRVSNVTFPNSRYGSDLYNSDNVTIENCIIPDAWIGISMSKGTNGTIKNITGSGSYIGIALHSSKNNTLTENNLTGLQYGIRASSSRNNQFTNNTVANSRSGFRFTSGSFYNKVSRNTISSSSEHGIEVVQRSHWNSFFNNTISASGAYGFYVETSWYNTIYHNMFLSNSQSAYDDTDLNQWDNGYPSGGNYWSDYSGFDVRRGPNQNIPGSDGIGDVPYSIDADSRDRYPLASPGTDYVSPPRNITAILSGPFHENVTVIWEPSLHEATGQVKSYVVFRGNLGYNVGGLNYQFIGAVPNGTYSYVDFAAGNVDIRPYFYIVCSVNLTNNASCGDNQAGKMRRVLQKGPNLVSMPLIPVDEKIGTVLQTVTYDSAWHFDSFSQEWLSITDSKPYVKGLHQMNSTMGIWVNVTETSNFTVAGAVPTTTSVPLKAGWNLVGSPFSADGITVLELKQSIQTERIEGYDSASPPYFLRAMTDGEFLTPLFGYWVKVKSDAVWSIEN